MQELLRQVTRAKEVELSVARDAIAALKSEQESQSESIKQAIRTETAQLRYTPIATLAKSLPYLRNVVISSSFFRYVRVVMLVEKLRREVASLKNSCGFSRAACQLHGRKLNSNSAFRATSGSRSATVYMHSCRKRHIGGR